MVIDFFVWVLETTVRVCIYTSMVMDTLKSILDYCETFAYILLLVFVVSIVMSLFFSRLIGLMMMSLSLSLLPWAVVGWQLHKHNPTLIDKLPQLASKVDEISEISSKLPNLPSVPSETDVMAALQNKGIGN